MDTFSELLHELAQTERHLAEGQARIARQLSSCASWAPAATTRISLRNG
jgi:hypothetical protein